jgi:hypothetical protein
VCQSKVVACTFHENRRTTDIPVGGILGVFFLFARSVVTDEMFPITKKKKNELAGDIQNRLLHTRGLTYE